MESGFICLFELSCASIENHVNRPQTLYSSAFQRRKGGARYRVRTCDPYRVKVVLYH